MSAYDLFNLSKRKMIYIAPPNVKPLADVADLGEELSTKT
jgi:hypothetical protein